MEKFILSLGLCSAEMSAVALAYMGLLRVLKNRQLPVLRYYSWLVILTGFLCPVKPSLGRAAVVLTEPGTAYTYKEQSANAAAPADIYQILFTVWLTVSALCIITSVLRYRRFRRSIGRLSRRADPRVQALGSQIARELGIKAPVTVLVMGDIATPMMTGLTAPAVLLPDRSFEPEELRLILKHELTHFRHRDLWVKLLVMVCRAVYWFDPVFILISRSIDQECEHYCDSSVVRDEDMARKRLYCQSILNTVSARNSLHRTALRPVMATNFYTPKQGLKHRLSLVLSTGRRRRFAAVAAVAAVLTAVSGSLAAFETVEPARRESTPARAATVTVEETAAYQETAAALDTAPAVTEVPDQADTVTYSETYEPIVTTVPAPWTEETQTSTVTTVTWQWEP